MNGGGGLFVRKCFNVNFINKPEMSNFSDGFFNLGPGLLVSFVFIAMASQE